MAGRFAHLERKRSTAVKSTRQRSKLQNPPPPQHPLSKAVAAGVLLILKTASQGGASLMFVDPIER